MNILAWLQKKVKKMKSWDFTNDLGPVLSREDEFILDWMDCEEQWSDLINMLEKNLNLRSQQSFHLSEKRKIILWGERIYNIFFKWEPNSYLVELIICFRKLRSMESDFLRQVWHLLHNSCDDDSQFWALCKTPEIGCITL